MSGRQPQETPVDGKVPWKASLMEEMWAEAAKEFENICGKSLQKGDVMGFDDVQKKIEGGSMATYRTDPGQEDKWQKAKGVGLSSLRYLKMLVGAASQASSFVSAAWLDWLIAR